MPPASGVAPLWTPCLRGLRFDWGSDHPPGPRPVQEGGVNENSGGHPLTPAKGLQPSGLLLLHSCHCEEWSDAAIWGGGVTP